MVAWTSDGRSLNANAHGYPNRDGNYFWAEGTEKPDPGVG